MKDCLFLLWTFYFILFIDFFGFSRTVGRKNDAYSWKPKRKVENPKLLETFQSFWKHQNQTTIDINFVAGEMHMLYKWNHPIKFVLVHTYYTYYTNTHYTHISIYYLLFDFFSLFFIYYVCGKT